MFALDTNLHQIRLVPFNTNTVFLISKPWSGDQEYTQGLHIPFPLLITNPFLLSPFNVNYKTALRQHFFISLAPLKRCLQTWVPPTDGQSLFSFPNNPVWRNQAFWTRATKPSELKSEFLESFEHHGVPKLGYFVRLLIVFIPLSPWVS